MPSPLFQNAAREIRRTARSAFQQSTFGRLMAEVEKVGHGPAAGKSRMRGIVKKYGSRWRPEQILKEAMGVEFGQIVREVAVYSRRGGVLRKVLNEFLDALGPTGNLIRAIAGTGAHRPGGILERELAAATQLLEAHGRAVIGPPGTASLGKMQSGITGLIDYLHDRGYEVVAPEGDVPKKKTLPFGESLQTAAGQKRKTLTLPDPSGRGLRLPVDHPLVTGDFVRVKSSNVHSFGYDPDNAFLYVRFLADERGTGEKSQAPGALYRYRDIPPRLAMALFNAPSKGSWVWDNLSIRGTHAGYRKPYALVGVIEGYVPRQATLMPGGEEWFIRRQLHVGGGRWLLSERPDQLVGIVGPGGGGQPNRGGPNRGRPAGPNRGKPNTGRP